MDGPVDQCVSTWVVGIHFCVANYQMLKTTHCLRPKKTTQVLTAAKFAFNKTAC